MNGYISHHFDSISALGAYCDGLEAVDGAARSSYKAPELDWDLNIGFPGAVSMAHAGGYWPEGADQMLESHNDMATLKAEGAVPVEEYDVTGHTFDLDEYLSGSPECFITDGEEDMARKPVLSIGVQVGRAALVDGSSVVLRGAAILSVIDDLESQGYRVELWGLWAQQQRSGPGTDFRVLLKGAEDAWSPHSVAFGICHPAMNRRLFWRVAESKAELNDLTNDGYSRGMGKGSWISEEFDVFFGWQTDDYYSAQQALEDIQYEVKQQLENDE